jgi:hypothetical protein
VSAEEEEDLRAPIAEEDAGHGSDFNARLMVLWSSPVFRFAFRAAIPIALVVLVAILVGAH